MTFSSVRIPKIGYDNTYYPGGGQESNFKRYGNHKRKRVFLLLAVLPTCEKIVKQ